MTMTADTRSQRLAYGALIAFTAAVGVVTFVLSFYGLRDYGIRVERLPVRMAWMVPVGVDILSLCGVAGTYLLRNAALRVRAYAWLVFGVAVSASIAGNVTHAVAQRLDGAGMVGAAAWPVFLALAAHFVIVARRALERGAQSASQHEVAPDQPAAQRDARPSERPASLAPRNEVPEPATQPSRKPAQPPAPARTSRPVASPSPRAVARPEDPRKAEVLRLYAQLGSARKAVEAMNGNAPSLRTVSYWISQASKHTTAQHATREDG